LAAYIVERISGVPYYDYVRKNIFEPLEMNDSSICADLSDNEDVKERRKQLKIYTTEVQEITPNMSYIVMYPAGMCISTIGDMQKFAQALLSDDTVLFQDKETYRELFTPSLYFEGTHNPRNYHGFWALESFGTKVIGHGGNTAGCSSYLLLDIENQVGMVIQANQYVEEIYNFQMPKLLFGEYEGTASDYSGLIMSARTIFHGPLKLYRLLSVTNVGEGEPAQSYDVRTNENGIDKISCPYGDYLIIGVKDIAVDLAILLLYLITIVYCVINVVRCFIVGVVNKVKGKKVKKEMNLWSLAGTVLPLVTVAVFGLMIPTLFNFQQWSVLAYRFSLFLILLSAVAMSVLVIYGLIKMKKCPMKKSRRIYIHFINVCMVVAIVNIIYWSWGMFWMI